MKITIIGHSTVLIETNTIRVLTDPYFGTWGNPAYARLRPPARRRDQLLDVDVVLVSHNHWDHTDRRFFRSLPRKATILAPRVSAWITRVKGARTVLGLHPWEKRTFGETEITAVPACHWAVTVGFVLAAEGKSLCFSGDTFYRPFMREIGRRLALDVALVPVATYRIPMTMGETGAVRAVRDLAPRFVIPVHLGIQPRSPLLRTRQSPAGFKRRLEEAALPTRVVLLEDGASFEF